jgi:predicted dehydrogenase
MMDVVLVGVCGYGAYYFEQFINSHVNRDFIEARICAVIDPFAKNSPHWGYITENAIPVFKTLEEFYENHGKADLAIISSPIQFHRPQAETAMANGTAVLCEKPLCANETEARALYETWQKNRVAFGVGFQWSFSAVMENLKHDILNGLFGKPLFLKTMVSWPKDDVYYDPAGWKGKMKDRYGNTVNDSVAMNATAHYLHNMLFLLGEEMNAAACPATIKGGIYRARDIETFDTCFLKGSFANGCEMLYVVSHAAQKVINPCFEYRFTKGTVRYDENASGVVRAAFADGTVKEYGKPNTDESNRRKIIKMMEAIQNKTQPVCGIGTVLPHLRVCDAMLKEMEIKTVPGEYVVREKERFFVKGLNEVMENFYTLEDFPLSSSVPWFEPERMVLI